MKKYARYRQDNFQYNPKRVRVSPLAFSIRSTVFKGKHNLLLVL